MVGCLCGYTWIRLREVPPFCEVKGATPKESAKKKLACAPRGILFANLTPRVLQGTLATTFFIDYFLDLHDGLRRLKLICHVRFLHTS